MSQPYEVDLESETILLEGAWLSSDDLSQRLTAAIAARNFAGVGRLGEALEALAQSISAAKTLTLKLSSDDYARLASAGQRLGQTPEVFARELLLQVLAGGQAAAPAAKAPPVAAPPPMTLDAPGGLTSSDVSPEEAAAALEIKPKRKGSTPSAPPASSAPTVVVDAGADESTNPRSGAPSRSWFPRS